MTFTRTRDFALIRATMTDPRLYEHGADDFAPARDRFEPRQDEGIYYIRVDDAGEFLGLFIFAPQSSVCWEIHTRILPAAWGRRAAEAAAEVTGWAFENLPRCRRIVTTVPGSNRLAIRFAERAGLQQFGRNPRSYLKHGKLLDQIWLGISPSAKE